MENQVKDSTKEKQANYEGCCMSNLDVCGPFSRKGYDGMFEVKDILEDVKPHLISLKLVGRGSNVSNWNEKLLIENRTRMKLKHDGFICAKHRYKFGIYYKPPTLCQHPEHLDKKKVSTRVAPIELAEFISAQYDKTFSLGSSLCFNHLKQETKHKKDMDAEVNIGESTAINESKLEESNRTLDTSFHPDEVQLTNEDLENKKINDLCKVLEISPVRFQLKRKRVENVSDHTIRYFQTKKRKIIDCIEKEFSAYASPAQSEKLFETLSSQASSSSSFNGEEPVLDDLQNLLETYTKSDSYGKITSLSLVNHDKYTKEYLMKVFNCSKYQIEKAKR